MWNRYQPQEHSETSPGQSDSEIEGARRIWTYIQAQKELPPSWSAAGLTSATLSASCHLTQFSARISATQSRREVQAESLHQQTEITFLLHITNKMQRYTIFFIAVNALHVSAGFSAHHQELKTVHTASGICQACLLLPQVVAASKLGIYQMLCVQFWAPDDGWRNRPKRVQHWQQ